MQRNMVHQALAAIRKPSLRTAAGWIVGVILVIWLAHAIDWPAALRTLARLHAGWVALSAIALGLHTLARALRWCALLYPSSVPLEPALTAMLVGQTLNHWLPVRLGDVPRVAWLSSHTGVRQSHAVVTLLAEKLWDTLPLIAVLYLVGWEGSVPAAIVGPLQSAAVLGTLVGVALVVVAGLSTRLVGVMRRLTHERASPIRLRLLQMGSGLLEGIRAMQAPSTVGQAAWWTVVAWLLGAAANWLAFQSLQMPLGWDAALLVSAALRVGVSLSTVPAAIGVYEGAIVVSLSVFSVPPDVALSYALVMHAIDLVVPLVMTIFLVVRDARHPAVERGV